jgi:hypothetical protein
LATNPTTYPERDPRRVDADVAIAETQRAKLEAEMDRTGQSGALAVAPLTRHSLPSGRACTSTTWSSTHITVLPQADVITLVQIPPALDDVTVTMTLRWDVMARVCGTTCWQHIPDLAPARWITRRWPTAPELEILAGLAIVPA